LKKKTRVSTGFYRVAQVTGQTARVNQVLPGFCSSRSFVLPDPIQPSGPGSTHWAGSGLFHYNIRQFTMDCYNKIIYFPLIEKKKASRLVFFFCLFHWAISNEKIVWVCVCVFLFVLKH
jgi:hypothetical protein